jgi:hypothetical protein
MEAAGCNAFLGHRDFDVARRKQGLCPVLGCESRLADVQFRGRPMPWCRKHGIRLHSGTFVYYNDEQSADDARLQNFIVRKDLAGAIALAKGMKAESHRLGYEMSEDALSWNVFVSLAAAKRLRLAAEFLTGRHCHREPDLYLWGRRVDESAVGHGAYEPLLRVRARLEPDIRPFVTEPDIMLVAEGEMLICIEAKFGSANPLSYDAELKLGEKPTSIAGLIERYLSDRTTARTRATVRSAQVKDRVHSQLLRNVVFANEMAVEIPWHVVNLVSSTQAKGRDDARKSFEDPTPDVCLYLAPPAQHCFTFRTWEALYETVVRGVPELAQLDMYFHAKSAHFGQAFDLQTIKSSS